MKKKISIVAVAVLCLVAAVLAIHIYMVRPHINSNTVSMARIDIHQDVSDADAGKIELWLSNQLGVDKVFCNSKTEVVAFTYYPVKANPDLITKNFKAAFNLPKAVRYIPTEESMNSGCPVAGSSFSYKAYRYFSKIF